jgi:hypothetical protein
MLKLDASANKRLCKDGRSSLDGKAMLIELAIKKIDKERR